MAFRRPARRPLAGASLLGTVLTLTVASLGAGLAAPLAAQNTTTASRIGVHPVPPREVRAEHRRGSIVVDGLLNEDAWSGVDAATGLIQTDPHEGQPGLPTEVRFVYDDEALYIGARMFDPLGVRGVETSLARRDHQESGDQVAIVLDPFHDHLSRVRFQVNPSGVKGDMLGPGGTNLDPAWDPVWEVATSIDSLGWTAEMRIPFSQLRYPRDSVQTWGVQVLRYTQRLNESEMFAWWTKQEAGGPNRFHHLTGLRITARPSRLEVLPYTVARSRHLAVSDRRDPFNKDGVQDIRGGADLKYLLTSNLTLDATFNPDFGQVEADPAQVNLTAYENFFPEKRPFFVEGSGIFGFGGFNCHFCSNVSSMSLFYSRRVGRAPQGFVSRPHVYEDTPENATILGAGKLTGRTAKGWTVGVLDAVTRREFATALDSQWVQRAPDDSVLRPYRFGQQVEPLTNYFVGRVKKDIRQGNLVLGGIATSTVRRLDDPFLASRLARHAESVGSDWEWWLRGRRYRLMGSVALSNVEADSAALLRLQRSSARYFQRPDRDQGSGGRFLDRYLPGATAMAGHGGIVRLAKEEGSWLWEAQTHWRSPGFETNDIAFLTRADYVWQNANLLKVWTKPTRWYRDIALIGGAQQQFNFDGDRTDRQYHAYAGGTAPNYWSVSGFVIRHPGTLDDRLTRGGPVVRGYGWHYAQASVTTDTRKSLWLSTNPSYAWAENGVTDWAADLGVTWRPSSRITLNVNPAFNHDHTQNQYVLAADDPTATAFYGRRYVFATIVQNTASMSSRLNVTFSPNLTLELYAQPFVASGRHYDFKEFAAPREERRLAFGVDTGTITVTGSGFDKTWTIDPDGPASSAAPLITFSNRSQAQNFGLPLDFNYRSLIGNTVLRWEYRPGSTLFLVWSHNRSDLAPVGNLLLDRDRRALFGAQPNNVFLVKLNYWLAL